MFSMKLSTLYRATYIYLALPLFIFILSWLDYKAAALFIVLFLLGFYKLYYSIDDKKSNWKAPRSFLSLALLVAIIWCFFAGIGYFYYQSWDYHFRNAVFRDLINYDWPVMYDKANTPMVYYMGFWLLPAALAKITFLFSQNSDLAFWLGNIYLYIYAVIGVMLIFLNLAAILEINSVKKFILAEIIFIFFSGLDIIGYLFFQVTAQPFEYHLDWWASVIQYSSFSTGMFWVFNQFIMVSLATLLVCHEKAVCHFGFIIPIILFLAPYPTVGIGVLMIAYAGYCLYQTTNKKSFIMNDCFSVPNMIGVFWLLPLVILYFITNSEGMDKLWYVFSFITPKRLLLFMMLEFLLYVFILFASYKNNIFFIGTIISLCLIPFFRIDQQNNFCTRTSIPALIVLAVFVIKFLFDYYEKKKALSISLIILLLIGSATPVMEFYRGIHYTLEAKKLRLVKDEIYTLNQPFVRMPVFGWDANHQYTARNYRTDIFWQYLAKNNLTKHY
ncbi:MAG: hypothetical protein J6W96_01175 [Alphaproteobacteria bacterium]|nr:hypothetical protein [Alphaproteobacteria bacterium]